MSSMDPAYHCFKQSDEAPGQDPSDEAEVDWKEKRVLKCRHCGNPVTSRDDAVEIEGRHAHTFFNPAGILFEIGCFDRAPGCFNTGTPTTEFAWFKNCSWRYSFCMSCQSHLGWQFIKTDDIRFFGLVLNRLTEDG